MPRRNKRTCKKQSKRSKRSDGRSDKRCSKRSDWRSDGRIVKRCNRKTCRMRGGNGVGTVTMTTPPGAIPLNRNEVDLRPQMSGGGFFTDFGTITGSGTTANMLNGIQLNNTQSITVPPVKAMI